MLREHNDGHTATVPFSSGLPASSQCTCTTNPTDYLLRSPSLKTTEFPKTAMKDLMGRPFEDSEWNEYELLENSRAHNNPRRRESKKKAEGSDTDSIERIVIFCFASSH